MREARLFLFSVSSPPAVCAVGSKGCDASYVPDANVFLVYKYLGPHCLEDLLSFSITFLFPLFCRHPHKPCIVTCALVVHGAAPTLGVHVNVGGTDSFPPGLQGQGSSQPKDRADRTMLALFWPEEFTVRAAFCVVGWLHSAVWPR